MAVAPQTIDRKVALERTFAAAFAALDDSKDPLIVSHLYEFIVKHVRSAQPMALLGGVSDVVSPVQEAIVQLDDGARVEVRRIDGRVNLYVLAADGHDASVSATDAQAGEVEKAVMAVMSGGAL